MGKKNMLSVHIQPVFEFLQTIPKGKVVTYKAVAKHCGMTNPRHVSWVLRQNSEPEKIPCYKVVRTGGNLATGYKFGGEKEQKKRLLADGVLFDANRVLDECFIQ